MCCSLYIILRLHLPLSLAVRTRHFLSKFVHTRRYISRFPSSFILQIIMHAYIMHASLHDSNEPRYNMTNQGILGHWCSHFTPLCSILLHLLLHLLIISIEHSVNILVRLITFNSCITSISHEPVPDSSISHEPVPDCLGCGVQPQVLCEPDAVLMPGPGWNLQTPSSCGGFMGYCTGNCSRVEPDQYGQAGMRACVNCGAEQTQQRCTGDFDDSYSDRGESYENY